MNLNMMPEQSEALKSVIATIKVGDVVRLETQVFGIEGTHIGEVEDIIAAPSFVPGRLYRLRGDIMPIPTGYITDVVFYEEKKVNA